MTCSDGATLDVASAEIAQSAYATDSDQEPEVSTCSRNLPAKRETKTLLILADLKHVVSNDLESDTSSECSASTSC